MTPPEHDPLETQLQRLIRGLPDRPAPSTLEARVHAAIAARAAQPWWRLGFLAWPAWARLSFLCLSAVAAGLWVLPGVRDAGDLPATADSLLRIPAPVATWGNAFVTVWDALRSVSAAIPLPWLYATAAGVVLLYAFLAGLGAIAYRTFQVNR